MISSRIKEKMSIKMAAFIVAMVIAISSFAQTPILYLDAADIDGLGANGCAATNTTWVDLTGNGHNGTLNAGFSLPCSATSGWDGTGVVGDPYRLKSNGPAIDEVLITNAPPAAAYEMWFNTDNQSGQLMWRRVGCCSFPSRAMFDAGALQSYYNLGSTMGTGVGVNEWHHLVITNDGSTTRYYLDGVEYASTSGSPETVNADIRLDSEELAYFKMYSSNLTKDQVESLYNGSVGRFYNVAASAPEIDRLLPAHVDITGGDTVMLKGRNFSGATSVTINGMSATSFTVIDDDEISVVVPSMSVAGNYDVTVNAPLGSHTSSNAIYYSNTGEPIANLVYHFDASNIDANGSQGATVNTTTWRSLVGGGSFGLENTFDFINSGWKGSGTPSDPNVLHFSTPEKMYGPSDPIETYAMWMRYDGTGGQFMRRRLGCCQFRSEVIMNRDNGLFMEYNHHGTSQEMFKGVGFGDDRMHHLVITNNGTTASFYLDGVKIGEQTGTTSEAASGFSDLMEIGDLTGEIASFRGYNVGLTEEQVEQLYYGEKDRFVSVGLNEVKIERLLPAVLSESGGTVNMAGFNLDQVTSVYVNGTSVSFTALDDNELSFTAPARGIGDYDVSIASASSMYTAERALKYTAIPLDSVKYWFDALNLDAKGTDPQDVPLTTSWFSLTNGDQAHWADFNNTQGDEWSGAGTAPNPYGATLGGTPFLQSGHIALPLDASNSYAFYFTLQSLSGEFFRRNHGCCSFPLQGIFNGTALQIKYNNGTTFTSPAVSIDSNYVLIISNDGSTTNYYLNGVLFGTESQGPENYAFHNASSRWNLRPSGAQPACIGRVIAFDRGLTPAEVDIITQEPGYVCGSARPAPIDADTICQGESADTLCIEPVFGATAYNWNVTGGTIVAGQGDTLIVVDWNSSPLGLQNVSVYGYNDCGSSDTTNVEIWVEDCPEICDNGIDDDGDGLIDCADTLDCAPDTPGVIAGPTDVCINQTGLAYSTPDLGAGYTYNWTFPAGVTVQSGSGTSTIVVDWGTTAGDVCLTITNDFGCTGPPLCLTISVTGQPALGKIRRK